MNIIVVGGGVAGLSAIYNLLKKNKSLEICLIEKNKRLGGLSKSFIYDDRFIFDIGPKRFHTEDALVMNFISEIGKHIKLRSIDRLSKVYFFNKHFFWPLKKEDIIKLPVNIAIRSVKDLLFKKKYKPQELLKFENFIISKYGETLYETFFKPYTEKFLRINIDDLHSDWASTGINRSIINKEHKSDTLMDLAQQVLFPANIDTNFLYPEIGGFGKFWDVCARLIQESGRAVIKTDSYITDIIKKDNSLIIQLSDTTQLKCDHLLWSGNLPDLIRCINKKNECRFNLPYIDTIFLDIIIKGEDVINEKAHCQWLYISSPEYEISRISFPKQFNEKNIPDGYTGLCAEVTIKETEKKFDKNLMIKKVLNELYKIKILSEKANIYHYNIHRENSTYPIYHRSYKQEIEKALASISDFSDKIIPFGRCGSFWYNNADHSIRQALALTENLAKGKRPEFNYRKYFGGISESFNNNSSSKVIG